MPQHSSGHLLPNGIFTSHFHEVFPNRCGKSSIFSMDRALNPFRHPINQGVGLIKDQAIKLRVLI
jgi:hypothetical protein